MTLEEAKSAIHLRKPYDNTNCRQCHTSTLHDWRRVPDHESLKEELADNRVSCASAGCHGYAHPFTKRDGLAPAVAGSAAVTGSAAMPRAAGSIPAPQSSTPPANTARQGP
jgi:hypothetical protein